VAASTSEQTSGVVASTFPTLHAGRVVPDIPGIDKIMSALLTRLIRGGAGVMCVGMRAYVRTRTHTADDRMPGARIYSLGVVKYRSWKSENVPAV